MSSDKMIEFEENNFDWLVDKFLQTKEASELWSDFIYNEYQNSQREPDDMGDI